jgi:hypothetical protein
MDGLQPFCIFVSDQVLIVSTFLSYILGPNNKKDLLDNRFDGSIQYSILDPFDTFIIILLLLEEVTPLQPAAMLSRPEIAAAFINFEHHFHWDCDSHSRTQSIETIDLSHM